MTVAEAIEIVESFRKRGLYINEWNRWVRLDQPLDSSNNFGGALDIVLEAAWKYEDLCK